MKRLSLSDWIRFKLRQEAEARRRYLLDCLREAVEKDELIRSRAEDILVFGSLVKGNTHARSDVDLAVRGPDSMRIIGRLLDYFEDEDEDVDIIPLDEETCPAIAEEIEKHGRPLLEVISRTDEHKMNSFLEHKYTVKAIFAVVLNDFEDALEEVRSLKRKLERLKIATDLEDRDSHMRAIATCVCRFYRGCERVLATIVRRCDGVLPKYDDRPRQIFLRAKTPLHDVRPAIISEETCRLLDRLRGFSHLFDGMYCRTLAPERVMEYAELALMVSQRFKEELERFMEAAQGVKDEARAREGGQ